MVYQHDIKPPLRRWLTKKMKAHLHECGYSGWVAIRLSHPERDWDRVFASPVYSPNGVVPQGERCHEGCSRWHWIPAKYLPQLDPAWIKEVRRLPTAG